MIRFDRDVPPGVVYVLNPGHIRLYVPSPLRWWERVARWLYLHWPRRGYKGTFRWEAPSRNG